MQTVKNSAGILRTTSYEASQRVSSKGYVGVRQCDIMAVKVPGEPNKKECPLHFVGNPPISFDCTREKCEWWIPEAGQCAMVVMAKKSL